MRHQTFRVGTLLIRVLVSAMLSACVALTNETPLEIPRADNELYDITLRVERLPGAQTVEVPVVTIDGTSREMTDIGSDLWRYTHQVPATSDQFEYRFSVDYTFAPIPGIFLFTNEATARLPQTAKSIVTNIPDPYTQHVQSYRQQYGKSAEWEQWMLDNRGRYESAFDKARTKPTPLDIAFRYDTTPIAYDPPWADEAEHMAALEALAEAAYPGYDFRFIFNGDTGASFANVIAGIPTNASYAAGKDMYLYYETIFSHEFAHVMAVLHHYDTPAETGAGNHMPPGETLCSMDRTSNQFCSAGRTALHIALDSDNAAAVSAAAVEILNRYPY